MNDWVEWIPRIDSECPVTKGVFVDVRFRSGEFWYNEEGVEWDWPNRNGLHNIVAYRVLSHAE